MSDDQHRTMRYSLTDRDSLDVVDIDQDSAMRFIRIPKGTTVSAYRSRQIPIDTSELYGVSVEELVMTHATVIRSKKFLATIRNAGDFDLRPAGVEDVVQWLQSILIVNPTSGKHIEIGIHGHISTKDQRREIVDAVVIAYRQFIAQSQSAASKKVIDLLTQARDDLQQQLTAAETAYRDLIDSEDATDAKLELSRSSIARLKQLLAKIDGELLELGIPRKIPSFDALAPPTSATQPAFPGETRGSPQCVC